MLSVSGISRANTRLYPSLSKKNVGTIETSQSIETIDTSKSSAAIRANRAIGFGQIVDDVDSEADTKAGGPKDDWKRLTLGRGQYEKMIADRAIEEEERDIEAEEAAIGYFLDIITSPVEEFDFDEAVDILYPAGRGYCTLESLHYPDEAAKMLFDVTDKLDILGATKMAVELLFHTGPKVVSGQLHDHNQSHKQNQEEALEILLDIGKWLEYLGAQEKAKEAYQTVIDSFWVADPKVGASLGKTANEAINKRNEINKQEKLKKE